MSVCVLCTRLDGGNRLEGEKICWIIWGSKRQIIAMFLLQMIFKIRPLINEYVGSRWHL